MGHIADKRTRKKNGNLDRWSDRELLDCNPSLKKNRHFNLIQKQLRYFSRQFFTLDDMLLHRCSQTRKRTMTSKIFLKNAQKII